MSFQLANTFRNNEIARSGVYAGMGSASYPIMRAAVRYAQRNAGSWTRGAIQTANNYLAAGKMKRQYKTNQSRLRGGNRSSKRSKVTLSTPQIIANNGESKSSFRLIKPVTSEVGKLTKEFTANVVMNNSAFRTEVTEGLQLAALLGDFFTDTDINQMFTLSASTPGSAKIFLKGVHAEAMIKNQCDSTARIKIYDVISRVDTNATTLDALTAFSLGFADNSGGAAANYIIPGATPYTNPRFVQFFKILNNTDVVLSPGSTHVHTIDYKPSKLISHINSAAIAGDGIAGLTLYSIMVYYGSPINAIDTQTEVTTSPISLDVVRTEEYKYGYVHPTGGVSSIINSLDLALSSAGAVMQEDGVELPFNEA